MSEEKLLPGRAYLIKIATRTLPVTVTELAHRIDVDTLATIPAEALALNEVGFCTLATAAPIAFDAYGESREMGGFILIDRFSNATVAGGLISHGLWHATNVHRQDLAVTKRGSRAPEAPPETGDPVVHRPFRRRQVDDRKSGGIAASCLRLSFGHARRRQSTPRPQQGSRLQPMPTGSRTSAVPARSPS